VSVNLLSPSPRTRIRAASFILAPLLKSSGRQIGEATAAFLRTLGTSHETVIFSASKIVPPSRDVFQFTQSHIYLWAKLETIKIARSHSKLACTSQALISTIEEFLPLDQFNFALSHNFDDIRLAALTALTISPSKTVPISPSSLKLLYGTLPFSFKSSSPSYLTTLCDLMASIFVRLSKVERKSFFEFIVSTLVTKNLYPSTIFEKEACALHIFNFLLTTNKKMNSNYFHDPMEILPLLVAPAAFHSIFSRLDSEWDRSRDQASTVLKKIISLKPNPLPSLLMAQSTFSRALFLASSPRSRESDSGAHLLFLLYMSSSTKDQFVDNLTSTLYSRVEAMAEALKNVNTAYDGQQLPLAHGLFLALNLILSFSEQDSGQTKKTFQSCLTAINISLAVVAESKDAADDDLAKGYAHADFESSHQLANANNVTLNVNGGCLGANTSFGGLVMDKNEMKRRNGVQRIVVGSWLLAKEASGCLAITSIAKNNDDENSVATAGGLLIKTLTTLKHQGAAFAAAAALNKISLHCFESSSSTVSNLPSSWMSGLIKEITHKTTVHQSTLRRSSGYAFGFLSMMKAECSCFPPTSPLSLTSGTIKALLNWSSPSASQFKGHVIRLGLELPKIIPIDDDLYDWKCRVHSMNILRLLLLDSTLSLQLAPYVGDALVIALLGFGDGSWAVSNSATMVFSAAMLKVVDSDKNSTASERSSMTPPSARPSASSAISGVGSGKGGKGRSSAAITPRQLFLTYPDLRSFLLAELCSSIGKASSSANTTVYSVMLLLSRLQPAQLDDEGVCREFIPQALECLCSKEHKLRLMASRALPVIVDSISSNKCLSYVQEVLLSLSSLDSKHGALLGISALRGSMLFYRKNSHSDIDSMALQNIVKLLKDEKCAGLGSEAFEAMRVLGAGSSLITSTAKAFFRTKFGRFVPSAKAVMAAARTIVTVGIQDGNVKDIMEVMRDGSHDARVAAIKGLKKVISNMEVVRGEKEWDFWGRVGLILKEALEREVKVEDRHEPNVRRISRCLVILENDFHISVGIKREDLTWLLLARNTQHKEVDNIVELLAIAGGGGMTEFAEQVEHSSDTDTTWWRCRLSVSEALGRAGGEKTKFLDLLQDDDVDVRKSASRCLGFDVVPEIAVRLCCEESGFGREEMLALFVEKVSRGLPNVVLYDERNQFLVASLLA